MGFDPRIALSALPQKFNCIKSFVTICAFTCLSFHFSLKCWRCCSSCSHFRFNFPFFPIFDSLSGSLALWWGTLRVLFLHSHSSPSATYIHPLPVSLFEIGLKWNERITYVFWRNFRQSLANYIFGYSLSRSLTHALLYFELLQKLCYANCKLTPAKSTSVPFCMFMYVRVCVCVPKYPNPQLFRFDSETKRTKPASCRNFAFSRPPSLGAPPHSFVISNAKVAAAF